MKNAMKVLVLSLFTLFTFESFGMTILKSGSSQTTWLSTTSCWSACYNAKNIAVAKYNATAAAMCKNGYKITKMPSCNWPAKDPSQVVLMKGDYWPVCHCTVSCKATFTCDNSGQYPDFFTGKNKKIAKANMSRVKEVKTALHDLKYVNDPETLYEFLTLAEHEFDLDVSDVKAKIEKGELKKVELPEVKTMTDELNHYGLESKSDCDKVKKFDIKPIKTIKPIRITKPILFSGESHLMQ